MTHAMLSAARDFGRTGERKRSVARRVSCWKSHVARIFRKVFSSIEKTVFFGSAHREDHNGMLISF